MLDRLDVLIDRTQMFSRRTNAVGRAGATAPPGGDTMNQAMPSMRLVFRAATQLSGAANTWVRGQGHLSLKDVFHRGDLVATPTQERAQLVYAIGGELARAMSSIDGILDARVHVVLPESDPLKRRIVPFSVSVFVRHAPEIQINPVLPQIKKLVADSAAGLDCEWISVTAAATRAIDKKDKQREAVVLGIRINRSSQWLTISLVSILFTTLLVMGTVLARLLLRIRRHAHFHVSFDGKESAT